MYCNGYSEGFFFSHLVARQFQLRFLVTPISQPLSLTWDDRSRPRSTQAGFFLLTAMQFSAIYLFIGFFGRCLSSHPALSCSKGGERRREICKGAKHNSSTLLTHTTHQAPFAAHHSVRHFFFIFFLVSWVGMGDWAILGFCW